MGLLSEKNFYLCSVSYEKWLLSIGMGANGAVEPIKVKLDGG